MKKICVLLLSALLCAGVCSAQSKVVVAVIGGQDNNINEVLGDQLLEAFVNSRNYIAIENNVDFLEALNKELSRQRDGTVREEDIVKLGRNFGAQYICVAKITDVSGYSDKYISARLLNTETSEVVTKTSESSPLNNLGVLLNVAKKMATVLADKTTKEKMIQKERAEKEKAERERTERVAREKSERERAEQAARNEKARQEQAARNTQIYRKQQVANAKIDKEKKVGYNCLMGGITSTIVGGGVLLIGAVDWNDETEYNGGTTTNVPVEGGDVSSITSPIGGTLVAVGVGLMIYGYYKKYVKDYSSYYTWQVPIGKKQYALIEPLPVVSHKMCGIGLSIRF